MQSLPPRNPSISVANRPFVHDRWEEPEVVADLPLPVASRVIRSILIRRGVEDAASFRRFTAPEIGDLHDPATIHGMAEACERIELAVGERQPIAIYGDYDVDGVTSVVMLQAVLRSLGANVTFVVPHRLVDGYGLKIEVVERLLAEQEIRLVITVDCGITSVEPVQKALERGIDVIITDHHLPPGILPGAVSVLNPKQPGCTYPFKELAGVGVTFKLCCELLRRNGRKLSIESLLRIAAIGTVADVAPLIEENRTIASLGLRALGEARNPGLRALLRRLGLAGKPLRASDVGFKLGPRINAAGRLASANTAIDLFAAVDEDSAWQLCAELDRLNAERQEIEARVREEAEALVDPGDRFIVVANEGWHRGVIGLTAGRLAQKYHRPALVIAGESGSSVGSARSIPTIDLHGCLARVNDLFTHFGGHQFACGFSLPTARIGELRERLNEAAADLDPALFQRVARVDGSIAFEDIDSDFVVSHELLQPFGAGNVQPLFLARGVEIRSVRTFADECAAVSLWDGRKAAEAVVWPSAQPVLAAMRQAGRSDILFHLEPDSYRDHLARLVLVDARAAE
ncbi:MAG TPA: single-stranded-DNA-specific exonuclease RecJ [Thermoanaerobaculia bacterium]|nr:single-stranded-DNA-specific exonuclease RecJ [Thermoanaerobaculia bacterium]